VLHHVTVMRTAYTAVIYIWVVSFCTDRPVIRP